MRQHDRLIFFFLPFFRWMKRHFNFKWSTWKIWLLESSSWNYFSNIIYRFDMKATQTVVLASDSVYWTALKSTADTNALWSQWLYEHGKRLFQFAFRGRKTNEFQFRIRIEKPQTAWYMKPHSITSITSHRLQSPYQPYFN